MSCQRAVIRQRPLTLSLRRVSPCPRRRPNGLAPALVRRVWDWHKTSSEKFPLMNYSAERELPKIYSPFRVWYMTFPVFIVVMILSALSIFNYLKVNSPTVNAVMYALRTNDVGREELGENIQFRDMFPWVWGKLDLVHGNINLSWGVKGTKNTGFLRFRCERLRHERFFSTKEWSLEMPDGKKMELLDLADMDPSKDIGTRSLIG